jgi:glycosyltransferase involved in cell wall biosynthesis
MSTVSVIVPCFNSARTIERALVSVHAQTLAPMEVLAVDDASNDDSVAVIEGLIWRLAPLNIKLIKLDYNQGAAVARNTGWDKARGDLIAFLDSDDSWHPRKLELQSNWMAKNPHIQVCGHGYDVAEDTGITKPEWPAIDDFGKAVHYSFEDFLVRNRLSTPTVMLRASVHERFPTNKRFCEDYDLWLQLCHNYGPCAWSETKLTRLHKQPWGISGLSGQLSAMHAAEKQCYEDCHQRKWISTPKLLLLKTLSTAKHLRRLLKKFLSKKPIN